MFRNSFFKFIHNRFTGIFIGAEVPVYKGFSKNVTSVAQPSIAGSETNQDPEI